MESLKKENKCAVRGENKGSDANGPKIKIINSLMLQQCFSHLVWEKSIPEKSLSPKTSNSM